MSNFQPPRDWDAVYAASESYFFGEEPSQIARTALRFFRTFGGSPGAALRWTSAAARAGTRRFWPRRV